MTYDLSSLLDASGAGLTIRSANAISDDGKIAGLACPSGDSNPAACRAVMLVPTTAPPPVPEYTRYLAEGATGALFDTRIALLNPAPHMRWRPFGTCVQATSQSRRRCMYRRAGA